jgi:hypothetical protein
MATDYDAFADAYSAENETGHGGMAGCRRVT